MTFHLYIFLWRVLRSYFKSIWNEKKNDNSTSLVFLHLMLLKLNDKKRQKIIPRCWFHFSDGSLWLEERVELATPLNSYKRLTEGTRLLRQGPTIFHDYCVKGLYNDHMLIYIDLIISPCHTFKKWSICHMNLTAPTVTSFKVDPLWLSITDSNEFMTL